MVSLVVVLPALPVIATTVAGDCSRTTRARSCSARVVSATSITTGAWRSEDATPGVTPGAATAPVRTTTPAAPRASASATNAWPSRSATMAKNRSPRWSVRVSIEKPSIAWSGWPPASRPPVAAAIIAAVSTITAAVT